MRLWGARTRTSTPPPFVQRARLEVHAAVVAAEQAARHAAESATRIKAARKHTTHGEDHE